MLLKLISEYSDYFRCYVISFFVIIKAHFLIRRIKIGYFWVIFFLLKTLDMARAPPQNSKRKKWEQQNEKGAERERGKKNEEQMRQRAGEGQRGQEALKQIARERQRENKKKIEWQIKMSVRAAQLGWRWQYSSPRQ